MLPKSFFEKESVELARDLLGCVLVHESPEGLTSGVIVETEAYDQDDAASHSYRGETERTKVMFGPAGYIYVYFTYGMHYCFNIVSGPEGRGQAVLIRALEPVQGIELMKSRRRRDTDLCNGPAKLVQAMGITKADYGKPVFESEIHLTKRLNEDFEVCVGPRIGITQAVDVPWRFWIKDNPHVSKLR